jgi:hypothetical protein
MLRGATRGAGADGMNTTGNRIGGWLSKKHANINDGWRLARIINFFPKKSAKKSASESASEWVMKEQLVSSWLALGA